MKITLRKVNRPLNNLTITQIKIFASFTIHVVSDNFFSFVFSFNGGLFKMPLGGLRMNNSLVLNFVKVNKEFLGHYFKIQFYCFLHNINLIT